MSDTIDISGLSKALVIAALYNGARPQGLGFLQYGEGSMTADEAQVYVDAGRLGFDYLNGRVMKVDLDGESFDPWLYDRDNGAGAAKVIIDELRREGVVDGVMTSTIHEHGRMHAANQTDEQIGGKTHWVEGEPIPTLETGYDELSEPVRQRIQPYLDNDDSKK